MADGNTGNAHEPPLTDEEIRYTRRMINADKRVHWVMGVLRTFALWLTAVTVAIVSTKNFILDMLGWHH